MTCPHSYNDRGTDAANLGADHCSICLRAEVEELRQTGAWKDDALHVIYESVLLGKTKGLFTPEQVRAIDIGFGFDSQGECEAAGRKSSAFFEGTTEARLAAEVEALRGLLRKVFDGNKLDCTECHCAECRSAYPHDCEIMRALGQTPAALERKGS